MEFYPYFHMYVLNSGEMLKEHVIILILSCVSEFYVQTGLAFFGFISYKFIYLFIIRFGWIHWISLDLSLVH